MRKYYTDPETAFMFQDEINGLLSSDAETVKKIGHCGNREKERKVPKMFMWHVREFTETNGDKTFRLEGNAVDVPYCINSERVVTKPLRKYEYREGSDEVLLYTDEIVYHCPIAECTFYREATVKMMPELKKFIDKKKALDPQPPVMTEDAVLLILSDHNEYFFEGGFIKFGEEIIRLVLTAHPGERRETCYINKDPKWQEMHLGKRPHINIYYVPHYYHLKFGLMETDDLPLYVENRGEYTIHLTTTEGIIESNPGERIKISKENTVRPEDIPFALDTTKLYWISGGEAY